MIIKYIANDGKEFNSQMDCENYEEELRQNKLQEQQKRFKDAYIEFTKVYYPNDTESLDKIQKLEHHYQVVAWFETDLKTLGLTHPLDEIKELVYSYLADCFIDKTEIDKLFNWSEIAKDIEIRSDFATALKNCKRGTDLSNPLCYAFSSRDISNLAILHKSNKYRKKIEDLLEDCNFHYECGEFMQGNYAEFIK